jgi:hypothetical protein
MRVRKSGLLAVALAAVSVPAAMLVWSSSAGAAAAADEPSSLVEDYSYPGAAAIAVADPRINLVSGDGHIILNSTCAAPATGVGRIAVISDQGDASPICFDVLAASGELSMRIDGVFSIDGRKAENGGAATATATIQPSGGAETSVTLNKDKTTPVGIGAGGDRTTLLELAVSAS